MRKPRCGKVVAVFTLVGAGSAEPSSIRCNRVAGHRPPCDLIILDRSQKPARRVRLNISRRGSA